MNEIARFEDSASHLAYPDPITQRRIEYLLSLGIHPEVAEISLEMIKMKLQDAVEGLGWSLEEAEIGEVKYKKYLTLCKKYGPGVVPSRRMDQFWHYHILDTRAYNADCNRVFGGFLHHYPYFGMRGEQDEKDLEAAFRVTEARYEETFGTSMTSEGEANCWHDCQGRCWHACKSN